MKNELAKAEINKETLRQAYQENLKLALPAVKQLEESVDGRTVVSSDHGDILGERTGPIPITEYGHPSGIYVGDLLEFLG